MEKINPKEIEILGLSVVNDIGFVFTWKNRLFRAINNEAVDKIKTLFKSSMIGELVENNLFPPSWMTDYKLDGCGLVVEHAKINVVSYPYEWSFSMLKDAALVVLKVNVIARKYGYQIHDCHAFNVVFDRMQPKYIDLGSFVKIKNESNDWIAYDEFLRSYYYPLSIWSSGNSFVARRLLSSETELMPHESYLLYKYTFARLIDASLIKKLINYYFIFRTLSSVPSTKIKNKIPGIIGSLICYFKENNLLPLQIANFDSLTYKIQKLSYKKSSSQWSEYHNEFYRDNGKLKLTPRFDRIVEITKNTNIRTVVELGGNQGILSKLLWKHTSVECVTCIDYDEGALEVMYLLSKNENIPLNPVLQDCVFPIVGSCGKPPWERFKSDVVIALALTHHLLLSQRLRIEFVLERISRYTKKYILIEFMPLGLWDGMSAAPLPEWYTLDWFRDSFEHYFNIILEEQLEENRILFFGEILDS